jgi:hypothetical protein
MNKQGGNAHHYYRWTRQSQMQFCGGFSVDTPRGTNKEDMPITIIGGIDSHRCNFAGSHILNPSKSKWMLHFSFQVAQVQLYGEAVIHIY